MYAAGGTRRGLDLATIIVVVAVFCFLGALPRRVHDAQEAALRYNLRSLRVAIELFKVQHDGRYPAERTRTSQEFHDQMLRPSNRAGSLGRSTDRAVQALSSFGRQSTCVQARTLPYTYSQSPYTYSQSFSHW